MQSSCMAHLSRKQSYLSTIHICWLISLVKTPHLSATVGSEVALKVTQCRLVLTIIPLRRLMGLIQVLSSEYPYASDANQMHLKERL